MAEARRLNGSNSTQNVHAHNAVRLPPSASSVSLAFPQSTSMHSLLAQASQVRSSGTWTTSSGELGLLSDTDEVEDRAIFVHEYNRLARKHGVRLLIVDDFSGDQQGHGVAKSPEKRGWLHRFLRSNPNNEQGALPAQITPPPCQLQLRHKRSVSDLAHMIRSRLEPPRVVCIQDMVRLSGKSMLYLPQDYAPCSLVLPTCLRATAQHLAQNAATRGLFRIPGSVKVVTTLFDHYCCPEPGGETIAGTVRSANLPLHMAFSVHDVASTFKKLLSALPGGILGSLSLFDALVAIHSQLNGEPEFPRTKQTKVRARLIALAVGTVKSQFRRELICAVVGLLSLIGRVAEVTPREDGDGRPLPTANLMGYSALGIVFGPLLVGDLLDQYAMKLATPTAGLLLLPFSPQKLRRERRRARADGKGAGPPTVNKIMVANDIAEMLIANWRDVVRQMRSLGAHHRKDPSLIHTRYNSTAPSASEPFTIKMPRDLDAVKARQTKDRDSPEPETPTMGLKRRRSRPVNTAAPPKLHHKASMQTLTPMMEEGSTDEASTRLEAASEQDKGKAADGKPGGEPEAVRDASHDQGQAKAPTDTCSGQSQVHLDCVPPRLSSRLKRGQDGSEMQTNMSYSTGGELADSSSIATRTEAARKRRQTKTSNQVDSNSIGSTPDYLYPPNNNGQSQPSHVTTEDETSSGQAAVGRQRGSSPPKSANIAGRLDSDLAEAFSPSQPDRGPACSPTEEKSLVTQAQGLKPHRKRPVRFIVRSPSHSDSSERLSKKGSVKAMAAMFEGQGLNLAKMSCPGHNGDADESGGRPDQAAPPCQCGQQALVDCCASDGLGPLIDEDDAGSREQEETDDSPSRHVFARQSLPALVPCPCSSLRAAQMLKTGPSLEKMGEQQHGKLTRSLSMPPLGCQALEEAAHTTGPCCSLSCQMHSLERKLSVREEEAAQLRRHIEAQGETEVGVLSEQLRTARRDTSIWRERANNAERRIKAFERFVARVRALKESMTAKEGDQLPTEKAFRPSPELRNTMGGDGAGSRRASLGRPTVGAEQMWAAVEELLRMEDEGCRDVPRMEEGGRT
ncbi:hypothetical protein XA68_11796 [Ophiocordyceps unilateralis]|uniref:Rho-GAP domain-containing protein n=1 Tax=Ophiocordyceps unilateralis TaxID=268505 RepID=A0A2A9PG35_OPHUN|nr:hypothetical protein XA68_11796 [Ophiocordyceps unilateralis]